MARVILIAGLFATLPAAGAQTAVDQQLKESGVCARCHVISVVEWGVSRHSRGGASCTDCHGESRGHVKDERNNIKPERIPRGRTADGLCATCHSPGCPKTARTSDCQSCHHAHALLNPDKPPVLKDERLDQLTRQWAEASRHLSEGERLVKREQWEQARVELRAAQAGNPYDRHAAALLKVCERRLAPALLGFDDAGSGWDPSTGLPRRVRVAGLDLDMVLVPGGDQDIGSAGFRAALPVHTVHLEPFYLGRCEVTQAQWNSLMGMNPSAHQGAEYPDAGSMPVEQVSWEDAQAFIAKLNERVPGKGFRLPAEAEWEFAARAGGPPSPENLARLAWFDGRTPAGAPHPAGTRQASALGLFDLYGNVWEWCSSLYAPYPYDAGDGRESLSAPGLRVLRGGGYADTEFLLDPGARHGERPQRRLKWNGLRIARDIPR